MTEQPPIADELSTPSEPPEGGRSVKRLVIGAIAAVVVLALAGGAFAVVKKLDGGGAQPHDVLPASVIAYARLDLDPSASQKIALFKLIRKFPKAAESVGIKSADQDVRKLIFTEILDQGGCDLSYDKDIEPWIGNRIGLALEKDGETPVFAVQVDDEGKAKKGLKALFACADDTAGVAFLDGYAIVAEKQATADEAVKDAKKAPLSTSKKFTKDMADLGNQGVFSAWADIKGIFGSAAVAGLGVPGLESQVDQSSTALTLRAQGSALELLSITRSPKADVAYKPSTIGRLPDDTAIGLSFPGLSAFPKEAQDELRSAFREGFNSELGEDGTSASLAPLEDELNLKLPDDLEAIFMDGFTAAIGAKNLDILPTLTGPADFGSLDVGVALQTDKDDAARLVTGLVKWADLLGVQLSGQENVIATNSDMAGSMARDGGLGKQKSFTEVIPDAEHAFTALYVDIDAIVSALLKADPPGDIEDGLNQMKPLKAAGLSVTSKDDGKLVRGSLRITFDE